MTGEVKDLCERLVEQIGNWNFGHASETAYEIKRACVRAGHHYVPQVFELSEALARGNYGEAITISRAFASEIQTTALAAA